MDVLLKLMCFIRPLKGDVLHGGHEHIANPGKTQNHVFNFTPRHPKLCSHIFTGPVRALKPGPGPVGNLGEQTEERAGQLNV